VKVLPELTDKLSLYLGNEVKYDIIDRGSKDPLKWSEVNIIFENFWSARNIILSLGRAVEVLEHIVVRRTIIDFARQIVDLYQE